MQNIIDGENSYCQAETFALPCRMAQVTFVLGHIFILTLVAKAYPLSTLCMYMHCVYAYAASSSGQYK